MIKEFKDKEYKEEDLDLYYFFNRRPMGDDIDNIYYKFQQEKEQD